MVSTLTNNTSTMERALYSIRSYIEQRTNYIYEADLDLGSTVVTLPNKYVEPVFSIRLNAQPDTRRCPVHKYRLYIYVGINRTVGEDAFSQDQKALGALDQICSALYEINAKRQIGIRSQTVVNKTTQVKGNTIIALAQLELTMFQRQTEYNL